MQLKKVECVGFKSFAERTIFQFDSGFTCLVGPNGCGKSNVVDAIKWVLGEQSAKSLRGKDMTDVIFNGSDESKSLGYGEVSLTFTNNSGLLPIEYDEVVVTRRVYRSGEGEYLINNKQCRLKDIKHLFMDTGIGVDSYSIIEQGKVDILLQANAIERRAIFEEAAGVSKYKAQKKEALAKLEKFEANLLRLGDIIEEVEKQLRSVKYQAAKARRYQRHMTEIKDLRVSFAIHDYNRMSGEKQGLSVRIAEKSDAENACKVELGVLRSEESELKLKLTEHDKLLEQTRQRCIVRQASIANIQERIEEIRRLFKEAREDEAHLQRRVAELHELCGEENKKKSVCEEELQRKSAERDGVHYTIGVIRKRLEEKDCEIQSLVEKIEFTKAAHIDLLQKSTSLHNQIGSISAEKKSLCRELEKVQEGIAKADERKQQVFFEKGKLEEKTIAIRKKLEVIEQDNRDFLQEIKKTENDIRHLQEKLNDGTNSVGSLKTKLEVLDDMDRNYEGIASAVREIVQKKSEDPGSFDGFIGILADLIEVKPEFVRAIDAALGEKAQAVLTSRLEHAVGLIQYLEERKAGRALFIPLENVNGSPRRPGPEIPKTLGLACDYVSCPPDIDELLRGMLSDTVICKDLEDALQVACASSEPLRVATLNGEIVEKNSSLFVSAGSTEGVPAGLLFRKNEKRRLRLEIESAESAIRGLSVSLSTKSAWLSEVERSKQRLCKERENIEEDLKTCEKQRDVLDKEIERIHDEIEIFQVEKIGAEAEIENLKAKEQTLTDEMAQLESEQSRTAADVVGLDDRCKEKSKERSSCSDELSQLQTKLAILDEQKKNLKTSLETVSLHIERSEKEINYSKESSDQVKQRIIRLEGESSEKKQELSNMLRENETSEARLSNLEEERGVLQQSISDNERTLSEKQEAAYSVEGEIQELRLKANEVHINMQNLANRIAEDYKVDLVEMLKAYTEDEKETDWNERKEKINQLRERIEHMGNVNLDAIDEQEQLEKRCNFLSTQRDDLLKAKHSLEQTVRKINKTSKDLFQATFDAVRAHFQVFFRKLFNGGKADVFLEDETNILESGVEIVARPPGKEPRSISLLSGGEKVMTATALLFSILKAKPSPFCIMDEVDAALDENNIDRFTMVLQEFLDECQIIVITHNKKTMAMADVIYGVTMQKSGISKRIAVKFEDISEKDGEIILPEESEVTSHSE